jgi:hypothetical protein
MRSALRDWLLGNDRDRPVLTTASHLSDDLDPQLNFSVLKAANGTILKVSKFRPNPRGPDWTHELHIVKDGETVADLFLSIYAAHTLEQK